MEGDRGRVSSCSSSSRSRQSENNSNALNLQDLKWENDLIELDFGSKNFAQKSIRPIEIKPVKKEAARNGWSMEAVAGPSRSAVIPKKQVAALPAFDRSLKPAFERPNRPTGTIPKVFKVVAPPPPKRFEEFELLESLLDASGVVFNFEAFTCKICFSDIEAGNGVTLRDCLHSFCRDCLTNTIHHSDDAMVKCPFVNDDYACEEFLQVILS